MRQINPVQWSKLKSRIKSLISPELRDRIDFHVTSYRKSHDGADKVWITVDGECVFECKHYPREWAEADLYHRGVDSDEISPALTAAEIHGPADFGNAMRAYLQMPVEEALGSSNPIIRAFAVVDRRVGRRTLAKLDVSDDDHTLVRAFFDLRCS